MGHTTCCVVNCKNNGTNSEYKFYKFPKTSHKLEQRRKWISAVRKLYPDSPLWSPKPHDSICSAHFIGNKKSEDEASPSYIPTIFPSVHKNKVTNPTEVITRHNQFMEQRVISQEELLNKIENIKEEVELDEVDNITINDFELNNIKVITSDKECQAEIFFNCFKLEHTFICNRYIARNNTSTNDVQIQTEIMINNSIPKLPNRKMFKNKKCGTKQTTFVDKLVGPDSETEDTLVSKYFTDIRSIKSNEQFLDLAGVTENNFKFLLKRLTEEDNWEISKENRLLIFLIKMKTGLSFLAISVLFSIDRMTVSRIFFTTLQTLCCTTQNLVFWPDKKVVQGTMPKCFHPYYSNTRVIIGCNEFRIEFPSNPDNHMYCYSDDKKAFTAKLLIGITPSGFISFKSKVAGGKKNNSHMLIESGLIDVLEDNDVILVEEDFRQFQKVINESGKKVVLVIPPFLEKKKQIANVETEDVYDIAKVRIHIERITERLKMYQILSEISADLFTCLDDITHICCVLVNLQSSIIENRN